MKYTLLFLIAILALTGCSEKPRDRGLVVATNGWTAAFARAAGAKNVVTLAPFDMAHPSEYELRAADIPIIKNAAMVVFAGYETMVKRLQSGMDLKPEVLVKIETDYSMATIEKSVMEIAQRLGTEKIALQNIDSIRHQLAEARAKFDRTGQNSNHILVNFFQQSLVASLGFESAGVFGPAALEATDIDRLAKTGASVVVDNEHNPVGLPLRDIKPGMVYRQLLNFPGLHQTESLQDVIRYNINQLDVYR